MYQSLTADQRKAIHDLALDARSLLTREARELLEGTYGLYGDGRIEPPEKLPQVQSDPEVAETYHRLAHFLDDEAHAGLARPDAADKLIREVAFTHLNRLVAFKMMEARKLIRGTLDKGPDSNGFKFYLADPDHADDLARYEQGGADIAYRRFLLWQSGQVAQEMRVLFDPDTLPSRLFPRPRALNGLLNTLNQAELADIWRADETIGWIYQYFGEPERKEWGQRKGEKVPPEVVPLKTQLYTPHWVVRVLVQNTLGRLWVQMHPDTRLIGTNLLDYLVPLDGQAPPEPLRAAKEITLLDPACGGMHFGLVAFDFFAAMYREELERTGEPGWPASPSVSDPAKIPAAVIKHNVFGIDIDLRAVQLSALALYLKAKSLNPKARIIESNLACADVLPLNGARLGEFLRQAHFSRPIYERVIRALWDRLRDVTQLGSLLRLDREIGGLIAEERARYEAMPLFAGLPGEFEREAAEEEFWDIISVQIVQGLNEFARQQARDGVDHTLFAGEATKGLRLLDLMLRHYDVVVTNPPYLDSRVYNLDLKRRLAHDYPSSKRNLYSAFVERCLELVSSGGRLGIITGQSFMFISSFKRFREQLRRSAIIETLLQFDYHLFEDARMDTACYVLRREPETPRREDSIGTYFRLVHEPDSESKRHAFEQALLDGSNTYHLAQRRFNAIPGASWVYWLSDGLCHLFEHLPPLGKVAQPRLNLVTADNFRFLRYWWEVGRSLISFDSFNRLEAQASGKCWFPHMKGGEYRKWYGNQEYVVNWKADGAEIRNFYKADGRLASRPQNMDYYFREGVTWTHTTAKGLNVRYLSPGFICNAEGMSAYPLVEQLKTDDLLGVLNSAFAGYIIALLNPSIHYGTREVQDLPFPVLSTNTGLDFGTEVIQSVHAAKFESLINESTFDFIVPLHWDTGLADLTTIRARLIDLESQIDDNTYRLYGINDEDRAVIKAELAEDPSAEEGAEDEAELEPPMTTEELAVHWISYALGILLGRFRPGVPGALGSAIYRREDFAVGSLPEPDETQFDELVGSPERFAYVDADGGRHLFPAEVEADLRGLAIPDGIAVLDEGHERDLPTLVQRALALMLGAEAAREVIAEGASGDLRRFLERNYFTKWHLKWYRKRPIYWPLQSAKRSYGFMLFHEKIDRSILYVLQRDYLDRKLNGLRLQIGDLQAQLEGKEGRARKQVERGIDQATQLLDELTDFAQAMERLVREGYEPEENWIDDGVILRMAPLWELIPIWWREPKKYWERLQQGDYDWSHIAMCYWPDRVREACRGNKSFAIAHGHEAVYQGG